MKSDSVEKILSYFSSKTLKSGIDNFDNQYLIKTNDRNSTKGIVNNTEIANLVISENVFFINGKPISRDDYLLIVNVNRNTNSYKKLKAVYNLIVMLIDEFIK
ncbi:MAG: hypothetical protein JEY96_19515 [Bacteroidales bacterium]|nr:hypothetical protein [Bacteroidales bacterium]